MNFTSRLALVPRDGLFCKDGRNWHTSASGRGHALDWPWPSTLLGSMRTAWGRATETKENRLFVKRDWETTKTSIHLGRTLALHRSGQNPLRRMDRMWPVPADALWLEGESDVVRLLPEAPRLQTLGTTDSKGIEGLWVPHVTNPAKPLSPPRWWREMELEAWLAGKSVKVVPRDKALAPKRRLDVHVKIQAETQTADEGILFSHDVLETLDREGEWAIGVEVELPSAAATKMATLGADNRLARIEEIGTELFEPPSSLPRAFNSRVYGLRLMLVTPAVFERGWLPDRFVETEDGFRGTLPGLTCELILKAAIVARPVCVSGWDMAAGKAKRTKRACPPGSVYFFIRADGKPFEETDAQSLWLTSFGAQTDEGFGRAVPGTWIPGSSKGR